MNLFEHLEQSSPLPDKAAVLLDGRGVSYPALFARIRDLSDRLAAAGVRQGSCVGVAMRNPVGYLSTVLALVRLGACASTFHTQWPAPMQQAIAKQHRLMAVVFDGVGDTPQVAAGTPVLLAQVLFAQRPAGMAASLAAQSAEHLPWFLAMSSGTTGMPKTIVRTQGAAQAYLDIRRPRLAQDARVMLPNELSMAWTMMSALQALQARATLVLSSAQHARDLMERMATDQPTHLVGSTDIVTKLAWYRSQQRLQAAVPAIHPMQVNVAGSMVSDAARALIRAELASRLVITYASSEAGVVAVLDDADPRVAAGQAGWLLDGVEVQALSDQGQPLPAGQVGPLRVRSPGMAEGYLDDDGALQPFEGGWCVSDDLGSVDAQGCLRLHGRVSDVLNLAGRKVDPLAIEHAIETHPDVSEAAVTALQPVGHPFEVLVAVLVSTRDVTLEELNAHLRDRLPPDKLPEFVVRVAQLPRNPMGKLMRRELAASIQMASPRNN